MPYLFVHFKEKLTPDGEQVYFAVSRDGFSFEEVNGGNPLLESKLSEKGCRDIEIVRLHTGGFVILTTDLCIVYRMDENHNVNWKEVNSHGSKCLCMWKTDDLVNFSEQKLIYFGRDDFGCLWAPEVFFDEENEEYLIHWGSTVKEDGYSHMSIYCSKTKDFESFSSPELYFTKNNEILDSHIQKVGDTYHLFYKNAEKPSMNMHATSKSLYGPFEHDEVFEKYMATLEKPGSYEAPTVYTLPNGEWCLMLDFFGCEKSKMGYVPFVSSAPGNCNFEMKKDFFSFPYGFKHGRVIEITQEEYERLKQL
ncbi:MAG: glycoside hydrolase family 43 protein [Clostridia bacterium]|nr:glycoside hydrolase family 43 protein [Clostridia bacterium]MBQ8029905.1 glycoside hydrolase family 43 protein [Clostridia bacterium]